MCPKHTPKENRGESARFHNYYAWQHGTHGAHNAWQCACNSRVCYSRYTIHTVHTRKPFKLDGMRMQHNTTPLPCRRRRQRTNQQHTPVHAPGKGCDESNKRDLKTADRQPAGKFTGNGQPCVGIGNPSAWPHGARLHNTNNTRDSRFWCRIDSCKHASICPSRVYLPNKTSSHMYNTQQGVLLSACVKHSFWFREISEQVGLRNDSDQVLHALLI